MLRSSCLCKSHSMLILFASIFIQFISGTANDLSNTKNETKTESHAKSHSNTGSEILIIVLGVMAVAGFSFFLFKLWQKKKREEQYARLLKLFEEDDELELELGLRD